MKLLRNKETIQAVSGNFPGTFEESMVTEMGMWDNSTGPAFCVNRMSGSSPTLRT